MLCSRLRLASRARLVCSWPESGMLRLARTPGIVCSQGGPRGKHSSEPQKRGEVFQPRSVRAMPIRLLSVTKGGSTALEQAAGEYVSRIKNYTSFEEVVVKPNPKNTADPALQKEAEGERVVKLIAAGSRVVMLDGRGKDISSEGLANLLAKAGDDGCPVVFVIGGPFGHGPQVQERADVTIRLSTMVLNHQVARLVLLEQIYRAWTIIKGEPYHH